jgi:hypothetical protein
MNLLLLVALILPGLAGLQQDLRTGVVEGVVVKTGTKVPVPDAKVVLELDTTDFIQARTVPFDPFSKPIVMETVSDGLGRFTFRDLPAGTVRVRASREGYLDPTNEYSASRGRLLAGARLEIPSVELRRISTLEGRVTDADGNPVAGAPVEFLKRETNDRGQLLWRSASPWVQTNDVGVFKTSALVPGTYFLRAIQRLPGGFRRDTYYPGTTDPSTASPVVVDEGQALIADIRLRPESASSLHKVSGRIVHALPRTATSPAISILLKRRLQDGPLEGTGAQTLVSTIADEASGQFEFQAVPTGVFDLEASGVITNSTYLATVPLEVVDEDIRGVTISLKPGVEVAGRILVDGDPLVLVPEQLRSIPQALRVTFGVSLSRPDRVTGGDTSMTVVVTGPSTPFAFRNVAEGTYNVSFREFSVNNLGAVSTMTAASPGAYVTDIRRGGVSVFDLGLRVGPEPINDLEILVGVEGGSISGTLSSRDITSAYVILMPIGAQRTNTLLYRRQLVKLEGASTTFTMSGIGPGEYRLFAVRDSGEPPPYLSPSFLAQYESRGVLTTVRKGQTTTIGSLEVLQ